MNLSSRVSKATVVAALSCLFSLVVFGNLTDYSTNFTFIRHVLAMDTTFAGAGTRYRAVSSVAAAHATFALIIAAEILATGLTWAGAVGMLRGARAGGPTYARARSRATAGLTLAYVVWQVGIFALGGEWFGMWMSKEWTAVESAFRFATLTIAALIYLNAPEPSADTPPAGDSPSDR